MRLDLEGKVALVTGSSRGLGNAIARELDASGCRVAINGRDASAVQSVAADLGADVIAAPGDVTTAAGAESVVRAVEEAAGGLDILVCNVGSGRGSRPGEEDSSEWQRMLAVNLLATVNVVRAAKPALARARGVVVCISSIAGIKVVGAPVAYTVAKAAINSYVRAMARPLAAQNIRINALAPGNIIFPGSVWERKLAEDCAAVEQMLAREVALGRFAEAGEIASWAVFLASARSSFATGSVFVVDGGQVT